MYWTDFDRYLRLLKEVFLENSLQRFVVLMSTFLLVPFESKLVNFLIRRKCFKKSEKSMRYVSFEANRTHKKNFYESSKTHHAHGTWIIIQIRLYVHTWRIKYMAQKEILEFVDDYLVVCFTRGLVANNFGLVIEIFLKICMQRNESFL